MLKYGTGNPFNGIPWVPISSEYSSIKNKGLRFGGQLNFAVMFRVDDTFIRTPGKPQETPIESLQEEPKETPQKTQGIP